MDKIKNDEERVAKVALISEYLNANNKFSEVHHQLMKSMQVSIISGGQASEMDTVTQQYSRKLYIKRR